MDVVAGARMMDAAHYKDLLQFAILYIEQQNKIVADSHRHHRSGQIEPGSVRREVAAANAWLEKARKAVK